MESATNPRRTFEEAKLQDLRREHSHAGAHHAACRQTKGRFICVYYCDLLHARVIITPNNQQLQILWPEPSFVDWYTSKIAVVMKSVFMNRARMFGKSSFMCGCT